MRQSVPRARIAPQRSAAGSSAPWVTRNGGPSSASTSALSVPKPASYLREDMDTNGGTGVRCGEMVTGISPVLEAPDELDATRLVLDAIRIVGCTSRSEVSRHAGLGRAAVAQRVAELVAAGLVEETGNGPSTGGRPPRQLRF